MFGLLICFVIKLEHKTFFKASSAQEIGTTCASMNRTGKTNAKKGPKDEYNAFRDFHDREVEAHILASFITHIGAPSLKGQLEVQCTF